MEMAREQYYIAKEQKESWHCYKLLLLLI
jgi:hypothetical protein